MHLCLYVFVFLEFYCMLLCMFAWQMHPFFPLSFWNSFLTFRWSFSSSFVLSAISSSPKSMAVTCVLFLTAAHGLRYALTIFNSDYNLNLTTLPPAFFLSLILSLSVNLFRERNCKLTKFQMAMAKASEQGNKLRRGEHTKHSSLHLHFHLIFLWPVALCTESIFLTPFPIYC